MDETQELSPNWAAVMSGIFIMIKHALKYREHYGNLPNHHYLMEKLQISYEIADHIITSAALITSEEPPIFRN
jgi:hypothetical protein